MKVDSKVQIINWMNTSTRRPDHWNFQGKMDEWCDKIVTIKQIMVNGKIRIYEDNQRWVWYPSDFRTPFLDDEMFEI